MASEFRWYPIALLLIFFLQLIGRTDLTVDLLCLCILGEDFPCSGRVWEPVRYAATNWAERTAAYPAAEQKSISEASVVSADISQNG